MKEKNKCYECEHRLEVPGSAHIACGIVSNSVIREVIGSGIITLVSESFKQDTSSTSAVIIKDTNGDTAIEFNAYGVLNNWCRWPAEFDPIWVNCYLDI